MALDIDPKADSPFKHMFGIEEQAPVLIHLLNAVMASPQAVTMIDYLPPQSELSGAGDKQVVSDLRVRDQGSRQFHVEMQRRWTWWFFKRLLLDWAKFHPSQLRRGETYHTLRPTVAICFLDDVIRAPRYAEVNSYRLVYRLQEVTHGVVLCDDITVYVIVLPWFTKGLDELETDLDRWLYFLRHAAKFDADNLPKALDIPPIRKAFEVLVMFSLNPELRAIYDAEERARMIRDSEMKDARDEGLDEGIDKGELIGSIRTYQKVLGLPETPKNELKARSEAELSALLAQLSSQPKSNGA